MKSTICLNDNNEVTTIQGESEPTKSVGDRRSKRGAGIPTTEGNYRRAVYEYLYIITLSPSLTIKEISVPFPLHIRSSK
jgi:hypothetical protein